MTPWMPNMILSRGFAISEAMVHAMVLARFTCWVPVTRKVVWNNRPQPVAPILPGGGMGFKTVLFCFLAYCQSPAQHGKCFMFHLGGCLRRRGWDTHGNHPLWWQPSQQAWQSI